MWRPVDDGGVPVEFAGGLALLVLPMAMLVLLLPAWIETGLAARDAARQAARLVAVEGEGQVRPAEELALRLLDERRVEARAVRVRLGDGAQTVRAEVTVRLPLLRLPWMGDVAVADRSVFHEESLDLYRSGP